jgi:hypothetical protein
VSQRHAVEIPGKTGLYDLYGIVGMSEAVRVERVERSRRYWWTGWVELGQRLWRKLGRGSRRDRLWKWLMSR